MEINCKIVALCLWYLGPVNATQVDTETALSWNTHVRFEWVKADGVSEQRAEVKVMCKKALQRGAPKPEEWKSKSDTDVLNYAHTAEIEASGHLPMSAKADGARVSCKLLP